MATRIIVFTATDYRTFPGPMPDILYLANRLPYPIDDGWKARSFHVLRAATAAGRTTLVTLAGHSAEAQQELQHILGTRLEIRTAAPMRYRAPRALVRGLLTDEPYHSANQRSAAMRELVRRLAGEGARVMLANTFFMAPYHAYAPHTHLVVDTHNIDSANLARYVPQLRGPKRAYASLTVPKMRASEAYWSGRADDVWVCSAEDAALLAQIAPQRAPYRVVPNGVDAERFSPRPAPRTPGRFVFFGRLDYFPNRDAIEYLAREILPRVPADVPLEIRVVGAGDLAPIRALAALDQRMTIVGRVPDVRDEVGSAVASLVPLRAGGGTRLKLLESLSLATPAISTTVGAEGLLPELADGVWLADTAEEFAAQLTALARDAAPAAARGVAGRAAVETQYHWPALEAVMQARLEALLAV